MTQQDRFQKVEELFRVARRLDPTEREAFLDEPCANDASLKAEVLALLAEDDRTLGMFDRPVLGEAMRISQIGSVAASAGGEQPGTVIDRYNLLQKIGEGGFGTVYMAEQEQPVQRKVALKIIKLGMDTRQVIARFEAERQALAMMDHLNIARVFDAGATENGRPYFVMELVRGVPITEFCDQDNLTTKQRLELFRCVCDAVQHAHQKGIIHRDIKPSNVLVTMHDGCPVPKVIDFGIAKATNRRLTERTLFTEFKQFIGTPEYMSPEQAEMSGLDVDTRSDVYSLGVLLYELLTGVTPFDGKRLRSAALDEVQRIIREEEPLKPSTRYSSLRGAIAAVPMGGEAPGAANGSASQPSSGEDIARHRHTDPGTLMRSLRGDLDWIIMKALEKDRTRRYDTAKDFGEDIRRHLDDEPVAAGPPGAAYRFKKFARRHQRAIGVAAAMIALLLAGAAASTILALRESQAREDAEENLQRAVDAESEAKTKAATAEQVAKFLVSMFEDSDPAQSRGETITAREILDRGAQRIRLELADQPQVQGTLMDVIGEVYQNIGLYRYAEPLLRDALRTRYNELGEDHLDSVNTLRKVARQHMEAAEYQQAETLYRRVLQVRRDQLGESHVDVAESVSNLAGPALYAGRFDEAEQLLRESLAIIERLKPADDVQLATALHNLGAVLRVQANYDEAVACFQRSLEITRRTYGNLHPKVSMGLSTYGLTLYEMGRATDAIPILREGLALAEQLWGTESENTSIVLNNLGLALQDAGMFAEAETVLRRALAADRARLGENDPAIATYLDNLAVLLHDQLKYDEAEPLYRQALDIRKRVHGEEHPDVAVSLNNIAMLLQDTGRLDEAETALTTSLAMRRRVYESNHPQVALAINNLASLMEAKQDYAQAEALYREALAMRLAMLGPEHAHVANSYNNIARVLDATGREAEAESLYRQTIDLRIRVLGKDHPQLAAAQVALAVLLMAQGHSSEAEPLLIDAHRIRNAAFGADQERTRDVARMLAELYDAVDRPQEAMDWRTRAQPTASGQAQ